MEEMDLKELLLALWEKKTIIAIAIILSLIIGIIYTFFYVTPEYESYTSLLLAKSQSVDGEGGAVGDNSNNEKITQTDLNLNQSLVTTYSELLKSKAVVREVLDIIQNNSELNIPDTLTEENIRNNIEVSSVKNTDIIKITVKNGEPKVAKEIAIQLSQAFIKKVSEIYNMNNVYVVDEAELQENPVNINYIRDIAIFAMIGIVLAIMYVLILEMFNVRIKTIADIEKITDIPILAELPKLNNKNGANSDIVAFEQPSSQVAEAFRSLRTNIQFSQNTQKIKSFLITSFNKGEGKSWVTSNLAVSFAQKNDNVILIDADMRAGRQQKAFNANAMFGLSDYLLKKERDSLVNYVADTPMKNLKLMVCGNCPPNPTELLLSKKLGRLIDETNDVADVVIVDAPPSTMIADTLVVARKIEGVIIVIEQGRVKKDELKRMIKELKKVGGNIIGLVFNKVPNTRKTYGKNVSYYGRKTDLIDTRGREDYE